MARNHNGMLVNMFQVMDTTLSNVADGGTVPTPAEIRRQKQDINK